MPQDYTAILEGLEAGGINVDGYSVDADDIWRLAQCLTSQARTAGRILFPERPVGYQRSTVSLGHYAFNLATAMRARARGEMNTAATYEKICETIYRRLPGYARW